jgi:hypothetical protein
MLIDGGAAVNLMLYSIFRKLGREDNELVKIIDISYVAPQAHGIVNIALHREYAPDIVFIFSYGRISIMSKTNTESNSNEY